MSSRHSHVSIRNRFCSILFDHLIRAGRGSKPSVTITSLDGAARSNSIHPTIHLTGQSMFVVTRNLHVVGLFAGAARVPAYALTLCCIKSTSNLTITRSKS